MVEKSQAEITYSVLDYNAPFRTPLLGIQSSPGVLVSKVLKELEPSGYTFSGVEVNLPTLKLDELTIMFRRTAPPTPNRNLSLGFGKVHITAENLDWTEAEQFISTHSAALNAVHDIAGAELQSQQLVVAMHIQVKDRPRKDVTAPLLSPVAAGLFDSEPEFSGVVLLQGRALILIDASVGIANGIFLRISREHGPKATFDELAEALRNDEKRVFETLGLEGVI